MPLAAAAAFSERLSGGVLLSAAKLRDQGWQDRDADALADPALPGLLSAISRLRQVPHNTAEQTENLLGELADRLRTHRPLLLAVLYAPHTVLARARELTERTSPDFHWAVLCWFSEAAWRCVEEGGSTDRLILRPLAARLRFLVLSEPFRHRAVEGRWPAGTDEPLHELVFGEGTWHELVGRCRHARWTWQECLDRHQSQPLLAQSDPAELEREMGLLVFRTGGAGRPLILGGEPLTRPGLPTADDRAVAEEMVQRHFLPRFQLGRVAAVAFSRPPRRHVFLAALPLMAAVASIVLAARGSFLRSGQTALLAYVLIGAGTVLSGRAFAAPWLLRLPAAATVGLLLMITLHPTWWDHPLSGTGTQAALVAAAFGYLIIEARNHGVSAARSILRATVVGLVGAVHSLLVGLVGLVLIAPAYMEAPEPGTRLTSRLTGADLAQSWQILSLATACCLAAGVFSQILWDDRPITAPLAHSSWSGR